MLEISVNSIIIHIFIFVLSIYLGMYNIRSATTNPTRMKKLEAGRKGMMRKSNPVTTHFSFVSIYKIKD